MKVTDKATVKKKAAYMHRRKVVFAVEKTRVYSRMIDNLMVMAARE